MKEPSYLAYSNSKIYEGFRLTDIQIQSLFTTTNLLLIIQLPKFATIHLLAAALNRFQPPVVAVVVVVDHR